MHIDPAEIASGKYSLTSGVFPCLMDIGEAMINCGADVHTVEQTLVRVGKAYGAKRMNVLVITALIVVTVTFPDNHERTFSRRILGDGGSDFAKLEALTSLCHKCVAHQLPSEEIRTELSKITSQKMPNFNLFVGGILSTGGFAMFFGGTIIDAIASAVFGVLVCLLLKYFKPLTPNPIVFNFVTSLLIGMIICFASWLVPPINVNMVIIGVIMLLIPGVAMTNATRDMLSGDTLSGVMRFIETLLWATALALGFMVALWVANVTGWQSKYITGTYEWPFWAMLPITFASTLGFALFFNVRRRHLLIAAVGGLVTWIIYYISSDLIHGVFVPCVIASTFAAIYAEALSRKFKVPNAVFFIIAVISLVPGRGLYYTMSNAVNGDISTCASYGISTLLFAAGIAVGICLIAAVVQTWDNFKAMREEREGRP